MVDRDRHSDGSVESADLPVGWTQVRVKDVVEAVPSINPETQPHKVFNYVDISAIDNEAFEITGGKSFTGADAPSRARRPIAPGDVLFSNVRTYLRNIAIVPQQSEFNVCSTGFTVMRPTGAVLSHYLFRFALTEDFIRSVSPHQTGTHYPATSDRKVLGESIPLPPLAEQRRIVVKVEELLARVNAARQRLAKVPALLKRFRQAVLAAAFDGRLTDSFRFGEVPNWQATTLGALFHVTTGGTPSRKRPELFIGPIPWIKTSEVHNCEIVGSEEHISAEALECSSAKLFPSGTLLIALYGEGRTRGQVGILRIDAATNQACAALVNTKLIETERRFVFFYLLSQYFVLRERAAGGTQPNLSVGLVRDLTIALPPLPEQHEIVRRVEALFARADKVAAAVAAAAKRVEALTQAILAKAFRGELVPTEAELARAEGRTYETAAQLLARVRAAVLAIVESATPEPHGKPRRRGRGA